MSGIVLGVVTGLTTGMLAVGLVLVYKSSRFINLAHGQLGALSAVLVATLVVDAGWSWWLAVPVAVVVGVLLALAVERFLVRPLRRQKRRGLSMLLVTIGIGQLLLALTYIPLFAPDPTKLSRESYPLPFRMHWRLLGGDLTGQHVLILVVVPLAVGAVAAFLRWTLLGKSIRAAASNADAARLCGISVDRINAITWAIAGGLSAVTAILLAPSQSVFDAGALGPGLLLRALGAAALGGFVSVPAAVVGGVGLGVIEQVTLSVTNRGSTAELAVFITVMAVLFLRGRQISATADGADDVVEDPSRTRVPAAVADRFVVRFHRLLLGIAGILAALALPNLPYFNRNEHQFLLVTILVFATVGVGLTMLLGWAGQVSLGHFAVLGAGAYVAAKLGPSNYSLPVVLVAGGLSGAVIMAVVGLPALRLKGLTLAVTTLGFAVAAPAWLFVQPWFGAEGQSTVHIPSLGIAGVGKTESQRGIYYVALALLVLTALAAGALRRSVPGRLIVAARDNERALATFGITPATMKLATLAVSGFVAGAAGVVWGAAWGDVSASLLAPAQSLSLLVLPVVGGAGSIAGAIAAAFVVFMPTYFIAPQLSGLLGQFGSNLGFQLALGGAGLALLPLFYPAGISGLAQSGWERVLKHLERDVKLWTPASKAQPLVARDVGISFGGIRALDEVSIEVRPAEIVGLIGSNGAGKTTLINVISGLLDASAGSVAIDGVDITAFPPEIRRSYGLGRSFQDARLFPGLTVAEAVQVALARTNRVGVLSSLTGSPWARAVDAQSRREAEQLLEAMGLHTWSEALTSELSTGLRRLTDLAMQVAARPRVLLLDEPTAGVAQREAEAFGPTLRRIRDDLGCSILIVEHDMPLLMGLCDRMYAMERGRIIAEGSPEEIRNNPMVIDSYLGVDSVAIERSGAGAPPADKRRTNGGSKRTRALRATETT
jgi:ABC-type branched-subunit amino acid transport system ATPase component/ABC-type branched-subunit amino acid transport system permease subunit